MIDHQSAVRVTRDGAVASVRMARPEQRNAFNPAMIAELTDVFRSFGGDDGVRVIVLSGEGSVFCAGADIDYMRTIGSFGHDENVADARRLGELFLAIRECPRPVVARVHGAAMGGGVGLVADCDLAVAAAGTRFAFSEARLGIVPAVIAPFVVPRIGVSAAQELFLTGERFDTERALAIGLVARVVPEDRLDGAVAERVASLLAGGPGAQATIKRLLAVVAGRDPALLDFTARLIAERRASPEAREGLSAFLERRRPDWEPPEDPATSSAQPPAGPGWAADAPAPARVSAPARDRAAGPGAPT
jgi:methylglutaconyl-CoA hydratase